MSARRAAGLLILASCIACTSQRTDRAPAAGTPLEPFYFVDIAAAAGVDIAQVGGSAEADWIIDSLGCGGAWLDYDGDGDADLYLAQGATKESPELGPPDRLLRNDGDIDGDGVPDFVDAGEAAGLGDRLWSFGVAAADYDNDSDTDLYLLNWGANRLYRNDGDGSFTEVAGPAGLGDDGWSVSAAWGDADADGDLDLFVVNYVDFAFERIPARGEATSSSSPPFTWKDLHVFYGPRGLPPGRDRYFRNDGDPDGDGVPAFVEATAAAGLVPPEDSYGLAARFFDADDDGDADLYVANDSLANHYFINRGDGTFSEHGILSGLAYSEQGHEQSGMGIAIGDYDGDGRNDVAVSNFSHDHDTLYRGDGRGLFTDASYLAGLGGATYLTLGWGLEFLDLDQDGWEDLFVAHGHVYPQVDRRDLGVTFAQTNAIFRNSGDGQFVDISASAGPALQAAKSSRALLPVDLDGDGDLDIAVTNLNDRVALLRNDGGPGHWLQVRLQGRASNRDGIGARVAIEAGGRRQQREITRTASYAGSILPIAHFGLGTVAVVQRLEIRWPSGRITVEENVDADRLVVVKESADG